MAKAIGAGFPMGAFWARGPYADLLSPGTHASTFGGTPLACAVGLRVLEVIRTERLDENARKMGEALKAGLNDLNRKYPGVIREVRGLGLLMGFELAPNLAKLSGDPTRTQAVRLVLQLQSAGLLVIPAGSNVIRLLPPLNLRSAEAEEGLAIIGSAIAKLAG